MIKERLSGFLYSAVYRDITDEFSEKDKLKEIGIKVEYFFFDAQAIIAILDVLIIYFLIKDSNSVEFTAGVLFFIQIIFYTFLRVFEKFLKDFKRELSLKVRKSS